MYSLLSHFLGNESREGSLRFKKTEKVILVLRKKLFTAQLQIHEFTFASQFLKSDILP
jgi:hypothetical protein